MCGIFGYVGNKKAAPILINGLKALEYRGYDSAGIALLENDAITVFKEKGRVKELESMLDYKNLCGTAGIAHTRWATHGKPNQVNAHPHYDNYKIFAVVHNGIIENYLELKEFLLEKGYHFDSETDTEVIPNLIHYYYKQEKDLLKAFHQTLKELKGSYAILLISSLQDGILAAKYGSPLVVGEGKEENFLASDIPAVLEYTKDFYFLNDGEMAFITKDHMTFYDGHLNPINLEKKIIDWDAKSADKNGYEDYMLKEIYEQPTAIYETIKGRILLNQKINFLDCDLNSEYLKTIHRIYIVACGTAMHAGLVGKKAFEKYTQITTIVEAASEFRYQNPLIDEHTLCIFISQSGETADTIAALKLAKEKNAKTIAISNVVGSSITRIADLVLYTHAGPEIAVASTKAYVSQVALIITLALSFAETLNTYSHDKIEDIKNELLELPDKINLLLEKIGNYKNIAKEIYKVTDVFYVGRGNDYNVSMEASLKLKEISYIHSEAYPAGELKHGPIALVQDGTVVIGIITNPDIAEKTLSNLLEVKARGAKVIIVTNLANLKTNSEIILLPTCDEVISPILAIIPLQLIAYYISKEKNLDVDKPRNLAKSVTVE